VVRKPAYNLKAIDKLRQKLTSDPTVWKFYSVILVGEDFATFVLTIGRLLGGNVPSEALTETCMDLLGQELTEQRFDAFARRVAANATRLRKGEPIRPWTRQDADEWAPVEVRRAWFGRNRRDEPGCYFLVEVLAGSPVGHRVTRFWTSPQYNYVARDLGFDSKSHPLQHPYQLVRLRFSALFEPRLSEESPGFQRIQATASQQDYNETILEGRFFREPGCRPKGFVHACHACWLGYGKCPYAVHPLTYRQAACENCLDPRAWHDPADDTDMCITCANKLRMKPRKDD
jgi:hypothetical protein